MKEKEEKNKVSAREIIKAIKDQGIKQKWLSEKLGVSEMTISYMINGRDGKEVVIPAKRKQELIKILGL